MFRPPALDDRSPRRARSVFQLRRKHRGRSRCFPACRGCRFHHRLAKKPRATFSAARSRTVRSVMSRSGSFAGSAGQQIILEEGLDGAGDSAWSVARAPPIQRLGASCSPPFAAPPHAAVPLRTAAPTRHPRTATAPDVRHSSPECLPGGAAIPSNSESVSRDITAKRLDTSERTCGTCMRRNGGTRSDRSSSRYR